MRCSNLIWRPDESHKVRDLTSEESTNSIKFLSCLDAILVFLLQKRSPLASLLLRYMRLVMGEMELQPKAGNFQFSWCRQWKTLVWTNWSLLSNNQQPTSWKCYERRSDSSCLYKQDPACAGCFAHPKPLFSFLLLRLERRKKTDIAFACPVHASRWATSDFTQLRGCPPTASLWQLEVSPQNPLPSPSCCLSLSFLWSRAAHQFTLEGPQKAMTFSLRFSMVHSQPTSLGDLLSGPESEQEKTT